MSESEIPDTLDTIGANEEFARAFGHAFMAWGNVEQRLFLWFQHITKLGSDMSRALYYASFNGFGGRAKMLINIIPATEITKDEREFLLVSVKKAKTLSDFRNTLGHGEAVFDLEMDPEPRARVLLTSGKYRFPDGIENAVTISKLRFATDQFTLLSAALTTALFRDQHAPPKPLSECLSLVRSIPNPSNWDQAILNGEET